MGWKEGQDCYNVVRMELGLGNTRITERVAVRAFEN